jgi:hypothetical protein
VGEARLDYIVPEEDHTKAHALLLYRSFGREHFLLLLPAPGALQNGIGCWHRIGSGYIPRNGTSGKHDANFAKANFTTIQLI